MHRAGFRISSSDRRRPEDPARGAANADAYNAFADAVAANAAKDDARRRRRCAARSRPIRIFLPHNSSRSSFSTRKGRMRMQSLRRSRSRAGSRQRRCGRAASPAPVSPADDLAAAFNGYAAVLKREPSDRRSAQHLGRYALAAGDDGHFNAAIVVSAASDAAAMHAPDVLVAAGRIDDAVDKYYELEKRLPRNAALSLKIGRIAVLRHSTRNRRDRAEEMEKADPLRRAHPEGVHRRAVGKQGGRRGGDEAAAAASKPGDDYWTTSPRSRRWAAIRAA